MGIPSLQDQQGLLVSLTQPQSRNADGVSCAGSMASVWIVRGVLGGRHFNHLAIAPTCTAAGRLSHMLFDYLLDSCFESHFSAFVPGAIRECSAGGLVKVSHIAQPKCRMRLVSLYGVCLDPPTQ